ncbi:MAG: septum site-determining protein MinC [Bacillus sp. (in: Bacteria)]|nr:septum site-determining protein MinC [Bacillus sp. (in: firmicutes)]
MAPKQVKKQNVLIKGTKDGLTFFLNDQCTFDSLIEELQDKLSERPVSLTTDPGYVKVKVVAGKRYLENSHLDKLEKTLFEFIKGVIITVESDVVTKAEAEEMRKSLEVTRLVKVVRSGQVLEVTGDLLLLGDVNPGATIKATGNIFVMGKLQGMAHAGADGNIKAVICASSLAPTQLRIADIIRQSSTEEMATPRVMGCAYIGENAREMMLESIQKLVNIRPDVSFGLTNVN